MKEVYHQSLSQSSNRLGSVGTIWRYPVKSMMGEELDVSEATDGGILGDRAYALIESATGRIASAKHPHKWGRLLDFRSEMTEAPALDEPIPPVQITIPSGDTITSEEENVDTVLSHELSRSVSLTKMRPESVSVERLDPFDSTTIMDIGPFMMKGKFLDYAALHILTTATMDRLRELYQRGRFEVRRFRPNIVIESRAECPDFIENAWVGRTLAIGEEVRVQVTDPCPRCSIPTLAQGDLPEDPRILRTVAEHNQVSVPVFNGLNLPSVGVYASVIRGGTIRRGNTVHLEAKGEH